MQINFKHFVLHLTQPSDYQTIIPTQDIYLKKHPYLV